MWCCLLLVIWWWLYHRGLDPTRNRTERAIRLCRLQYSTARANMMLPRNIMLLSCYLSKMGDSRHQQLVKELIVRNHHMYKVPSCRRYKRCPCLKCRGEGTRRRAANWWWAVGVIPSSNKRPLLEWRSRTTPPRTNLHFWNHQLINKKRVNLFN